MYFYKKCRFLQTFTFIVQTNKILTIFFARATSESSAEKHQEPANTLPLKDRISK